jgi:hypothetical protein
MEETDKTPTLGQPHKILSVEKQEQVLSEELSRIAADKEQIEAMRTLPENPFHRITDAWRRDIGCFYADVFSVLLRKKG